MATIVLSVLGVGVLSFSVLATMTAMVLQAATEFLKTLFVVSTC